MLLRWMELLMNLKKIERLLTLVSDKIEEDVLNNREYLIFIANLLLSFGKSGLKINYPDMEVDINDSNIVELRLNQDPNNVYLAAILQSHVLIKWSESFSDEQ